MRSTLEPLSLDQVVAWVAESPELFGLKMWPAFENGASILYIDFLSMELARKFWASRSNLLSAIFTLGIGSTIIFMVGTDRFGRTSHRG
jgi:hypothetical protein